MNHAAPRTWTTRTTILLMVFLVMLMGTDWDLPFCQDKKVGVANATTVMQRPTTKAVPPDTQPTRPPNVKAIQPAATVTDGITITGLDLHDGIVQKFGDTYYFYGTEYACGFQWGVASTHFCGYGVATAPALTGPWSGITQLVSPTTTDPWSGRTWDAQCMRNNGAGCFNPRMVQRPDGQYVFWFNAPDDYNIDHANAYNNYLCSGPAGPCNGAFTKPAAYTCSTANGDFSIFADGANAYLVCTGSNANNYAEFVEQLDSNWQNGTGNIAGHGSSPLFSAVEGAGIYKQSASNYIMTAANPECGYCDGEPTIYATSPNPIGPWASPVGHAAAFGSGPQSMSARYRATVSGNTCGGQPRTVMVLDGQAYQGIDLWDAGKLNETNATYMLQPLNFRSASNTPTAGWQPFDPWSCA